MSRPASRAILAQVIRAAMDDPKDGPGVGAVLQAVRASFSDPAHSCSRDGVITTRAPRGFAGVRIGPNEAIDLFLPLAIPGERLRRKREHGGGDPQWTKYALHCRSILEKAMTSERSWRS
jgi:hypothetical protein